MDNTVTGPVDWEHLPYNMLVGFDLDGTLVQTRSGATFRTLRQTGQMDRHGAFYYQDVLAEDDWEWLPGRIAVLQMLNARGIRLGICTNQGGIGAGHLDEIRMQGMLEQVKHEAAVPMSLHYCAYFPMRGKPTNGIEEVRRKPNPGMLFELARANGTVPTSDRMFFVGDRYEDWWASKLAGCSFMWSAAFFGDPPEMLAAQIAACEAARVKAEAERLARAEANANRFGSGY